MFEDLKEFLKEMWLKFVLLFAVFVIAGIGIGLGVESSLTPKTHTVSTMYVVKEGDTLIDICWTYQNLDCRHPYIFEYMDEVKELNPFLEERKNQLQIGDKIYIQYQEVSKP